MGTYPYAWSGHDDQGNVTAGSGSLLVDAPPVLEPTWTGVDWSTVSPTLPASQGGGPNPDYCPTYSTAWKSVRAYRNDHPRDIVAAYPGVKVIGVTDNQNWNVTGGQSTADAIVDMAIDFYEGSGSAARQNIGLDVAIQNETDNKFTSGTLPAAMVTTQRLTYEGLHQLKANGQPRFPMVDVGLDMTTYQLRVNGSGPRYKVMVPYIDAVFGSYYPIHRDDNPVVNWGDYGLYCDIFYQTMLDWRTVKPSLRKMAVWEVGSPIDRNMPSGAPNNGGATNWTKRPCYFTGGTDSTGKTWEGFYQYNRRKAQEINAWMRYMCYWNRQDNPIIPNPFKHDAAQGVNALAPRWLAISV